MFAPFETIIGIDERGHNHNRNADPVTDYTEHRSGYQGDNCVSEQPAIETHSNMSICSALPIPPYRLPDSIRHC